MNGIYDAYLNARPDITARFAAAPETLITKTIQPGRWSAGLAEAVNGFQRELGVEKAALTGSEAVIVTGQQPGIFTGPLYTIYKAITAIQAARHLASGGVPCVPVFWTAGDDHDFEEVRTAHFLTRKDEVLSFSCTGGVSCGRSADIPMHAMSLSPDTHRLIDKAADLCRNSDATAEVRDFLHASLDQSPTVSSWFSLIMARLFKETPLRLFEPRLEAARIAAMPVLRREIESPLESTRLLMESGKELESLGYKPPIHRGEKAANFFIEEDGRRKKVRFIDGRYLIAGSKKGYSVREMVALLESAPEKFSPNVALRPLVQQILFNPEAYIAGPGEIAYWAQLTPLFTFFELPMPIVYPRIQAVITSVKTKRLMDSWNLELKDLAGNAKLIDRILKSGPEDASLAALSEKRPLVEKAVGELACAVLGDSPSVNIQKAVDSFISHTRFRLEKLEGALLYADHEKRAAAEARLSRLRNILVPLGTPQERVFSVFTFLFRDGWPFMGRMLEELDWTRRGLQEMEW